MSFPIVVNWRFIGRFEEEKENSNLYVYVRNSKTYLRFSDEYELHEIVGSDHIDRRSTMKSTLIDWFTYIKNDIEIRHHIYTYECA